MALLKCPNCNQTVLSAACSCPRCGTVFNWERDRYPGDKPIRWWPIALGIGAVAALAFGVSRVAPQNSGAAFRPLALESDPRPLPVTPADTTGLPNPEPPPDTAADDTARPSTRSPVASPVSPPAQLPQSRRANVSGSRPAGAARTRWTSTWVNVRERPSNQSAVVRILNPGERVEVQDPNRSWSLVYMEGRPVGYLSVALLVTEPPGT